MQNTFVPYRFGYDFGIGVDGATGDRMQLGAAGDRVPVEGGSGGSGDFQMLRVETMSDLEEHLGISADASGGIGLFSASDRFSFAKDCKIQTYSIALMLTCTRRNGFVQIPEPRLTDAAGALVANGQADLFTQRFGDRFVIGIETGGQFFGVIRIDVRSEADKQDIENSLSGSYGPFSADVSVKVQSAMTRTNSRAEVFLHYEGGNVQTKPQQPADLFAAANEWSQSVIQSPKPYTALLVPWIIANGPIPPNAADLEHQKDVLTQCAKMRSQAIDRLNVLEYMTDAVHINEFAFGPNDSNRLAQLQAGISRDLDIIAAAASFAINNVKDAKLPEDFAASQRGLAGYTLTLLPPDLPKRIDGKSIIVPDFSTAQTMNDLNSLAAKNNLTMHYMTANPQPTYTFLRQDPAAGTPVAAGASVMVVGNGQPSSAPKNIGIFLRNPDLIQRAGVLGAANARFTG